ncbi:MAG: sel1 repeat family protein [Bacteroidales bacterium]|nr:sel1 repeat family protein [Bacteroidales bacterium]
MNKKIADLIVAAENNDDDAQNELYDYIGEDDLPVIDKKQIVDWLQRSAKLGNTNSMFWLGRCYSEGFGFAEDVKSAFDWFLKSADAGNGFAAGRVGEYYKEGKIVARDYFKAIDYFEKAIEICGKDYGVSDEMGARIGDVHKEDLTWWEAVANRKPSVVYPSVPFCVGNYYYLLDDPDLDRAIYFYRIGAEQGYGFSQYVLGKFYYKGEGVEKDHAKAFQWLEKAAQQDVAPAMYYLGMLYADDRSAMFNMEKAAFWWMSSLFMDNRQETMGLAELQLSWCYALDVGVDTDGTDFPYANADDCADYALYCLTCVNDNLSARDVVKIDEDSWWYRRVKQGDAQALYWMGMCYSEIERIVPPNGGDKNECTRDCFLKAAEKEHFGAQYIIAGYFYEGYGPVSVRDQEEGLRWYRLAAEQGYPDAIEKLEEIEAMSHRS